MKSCYLTEGKEKLQLIRGTRIGKQEEIKLVLTFANCTKLGQSEEPQNIVTFSAECECC